MNQKRFMAKNAHTEEDMSQIQHWKGAMKNMYDGLQEQNNLEEMALESAEVLGGESRKKEKKGFFSKMNDKISSAVHSNHQMNSNVLKKKK